jgi:MFS family permease
MLVSAFVLGVVSQGVKISVDTLVQEWVDDAFRGRVFSFYDVIFNVSFVAAAAVGAFILPDDGKSYAALALIAVGYAVTAATYWRIHIRSLRRSAQGL